MPPITNAQKKVETVSEVNLAEGHESCHRNSIRNIAPEPEVSRPQCLQFHCALQGRSYNILHVVMAYYNQIQTILIFL